MCFANCCAGSVVWYYSLKHGQLLSFFFFFSPFGCNNDILNYVSYLIEKLSFFTDKQFGMNKVWAEFGHISKSTFRSIHANNVQFL